MERGDRVNVILHPDSNGGDELAQGVVTRAWSAEVPDPHYRPREDEAPHSIPKVTAQLVNIRVDEVDGPILYLAEVQAFDDETAAYAWLDHQRSLVPVAKGDDPDPHRVWQWVPAVVYPLAAPVAAAAAPASPSLAPDSPPQT